MDDGSSLFRWHLPQINYELTLRILFHKKGVTRQNHAFFLLMV